MTTLAPYIILACLVFCFGVAGLLRYYEVKWIPEPKGAKPLPDSMRLVMCDCGAETKCPNGRDPQNGDPYKCKIWKKDPVDV